MPVPTSILKLHILLGTCLRFTTEIIQYCFYFPYKCVTRVWSALQVLVNSNRLGERVVVIPGKVEEVTLPEQVDVIISEPMGYMLFNERMLESYLHAKKFLKPSGEEE